MKRKSIIRALCLLAAVMIGAAANAQTTVTDKETDAPVTYASVFDKATGKFLGTTDGSGNLPGKAETAATISIQHLNYETATVDMATVEGGKISLTPLVRRIKEVTVNKEKHDYVRLKVYVRQLAWMTDTLAKVTKAICHLYMKPTKKGGSPKTTVLSQSTVFNKSALEGKNRKMTRAVIRVRPDMFLRFQGPKWVKKLPTDSVERQDLESLGGDWGIDYARYDWKNKRCDVVEDSVRFRKNWTIPFLGVSIGRMHSTETYDITHGAPKFTNLTNYLQGFRVTHNKSDTSVDLYQEFFVLEADYASKEDLEKEKEAKREKFVEPEGFPPLNEGVEESMKKMGRLTEQEFDELWFGDDTKK